jgi:hypothetical protein
MTDQPTEGIENGSNDDLSIETILEDGIKGLETTPEDGSQPEENKPNEEPILETPEGTDQTVEEKVEELFGELLLEGEKKLPFKTKDEFDKFIEQNPLLKEGYLRQSDYTRKTQTLAEERKAIEESQKKDVEAWGHVKPDDQSMNVMRDLWKVFQVVPDGQAKVIQSIFEDASRIARGENPVGPLAQSISGQDNANPEFNQLQTTINSLVRELNQIKLDRKTSESKQIEETQKKQMEEANRMVEDWFTKKKDSGVVVTPEEFRVMGSIQDGAINPKTGQPFTLDERYEVARAVLGKSEADIKKKVIATSQIQKKKTSSAPSSKAPSSAEPEPEDIEGILAQGIKQLQGA